MSDGVSSQNCMCACVRVFSYAEKKTFDERRKLKEDSGWLNHAGEEKTVLLWFPFDECRSRTSSAFTCTWAEEQRGRAND